MILKSLEAERFRVLKQVRLEFPDRGPILVEGPNESGKSTLFEAVFFALFGRGLRPDLTVGDLIAYGQDSAQVRVQLVSKELILDVRRVLSKPSRVIAELTLHWTDGKEETLSGTGAVTSRVFQVLGLDGDAFRNACLCEQKRLDRLESLSSAEREHTVMVLLNLDRLRSLERELRPTTAERRHVEQLCERAKLAELRVESARLKAEYERLGRQRAALTALRAARRADELRRDLEANRSRAAEALARLSAVERSLSRAEELEQAMVLADQLGVVAFTLAPLERELAEHHAAVGALQQLRDTQLPELRRRTLLLDRLLLRLDRIQRLKGTYDESKAVVERLQEVLRQADEAQAQIEERKQRLARACGEADRAASELHAADARTESVQRRLRALQRLADRLRRIDRIRSATENTAALVAEAERLQTEAEAARVRADAEQKKLASINARRGVLRALIKAEAVLSALEDWRSALELKRRVQALNAEAEDHSAKAEEATRLAQEAARRGESAQRWSLLCTVLAVASGTSSACLCFTLPYWYALASAAGVLLVPLAVTARAALVSRRLAKQYSQAWSAHAQSAVEAAKTCEGLLNAYHSRVLQGFGGDLEPGAVERAKLAELGVTPSEDPDEVERMISAAHAKVESRRKAWDALNGSRLNGSPTEALRVLDALSELTSEECRCAAAAAEEAVRRASEARQTAGGSRFEDLERWRDKRDQLISKWLDKAHETAESLGVAVAHRPSATADGIGEYLHAVRGAIGIVADELEAALSAKATAARSLSEAEAALTSASAALESAQRALDDLQPEQAQKQYQEAFRRLARIEDVVRRWEQTASRKADELGITPALTQVKTALAATEVELQQIEHRLSGMPELERRQAAITDSVAELHAEAAQLVEKLCRAVGVPAKNTESGQGLAEFARRVRSAAESELGTANATALRDERSRLQAEVEAFRAAIDALSDEVAKAESQAADVLVAFGMNVPPTITEKALVQTIPEAAECTDLSAEEVERDQRQTTARLAGVEAAVAELEERLGLTGVDLDAAEEARRRDEALRSLEAREKAVVLARTARERATAKVLPATIANMRRILPLVTCGRYHDVEIDEGYRVRLWDSRAGAWMLKDVFSGGAQDVFSLALRLAFALAALPGGSPRHPSFLVLDEPFSSLDAGRTRAVLSLLVDGPVAEAFDQVFVLSSNPPGIRFPFRSRLYLADGRADMVGLQ
ncbi:MAG: AAA family ATPase [Armatimonadota bacterium]